MSQDLNIRHLEYFLKVAQLGSINKAAQALFISQPYLGKIVHDLEDGFGHLLLNRGNQGVTLTPEGEEFAKWAAHILEEVGSLWRDSEEREDDYQHLAVSMTKFSHVMESFIEVVMRHRDQISFSHRLYEGSPDEVVEDVFTGRAAVGVFHFDRKRRGEVESLLSAKRLVYRHLAYSEPHVVLSKNHPLVRSGRPITLRALSPYGVIHYLGQYDDLVSSLLGSELVQDQDESKVIYLSNRESVLRLISVSDFYSLGIHDFELQDCGYQDVSIPIADCDFTFEFGYVYAKGTHLSRITQEFLKSIERMLN